MNDWKGGWKRLAHDLWAFALFILLFLLLRALRIALGGSGGICPSVLIFGIPCPGCGATRGALALVRGHLAQSWQYNPMVIPVGLFAVYAGFYHYFRQEKAPYLRVIVSFLCGMSILLYLERMVRIFPGSQPYVYTPGSLLERIIPGYAPWVTRTLRHFLDLFVM